MFHNVDLQWRFLYDNMTSYISIMDQWMEDVDEFICCGWKWKKVLLIMDEIQMFKGDFIHEQ
jgi:hypothetical protein